jgi:L-alanine-DL-glutamate epimerase-like enolase superfamily enzyme
VDAVARIVEVATARLVRELNQPFVTALRSTTQVVSVAVRLTTDDGAAGYGEAPQIWRVTGESQASVEACVLGPLADALLGLDLDAESVAAVHGLLARTVAGNTGARAACEVAAIDVVAQASGRGFAAFLGSSAETVATDITIAATVSDPAAERVPAGFAAAKIKVGIDPADVERVIRIHGEAGDGVRIRVDANQAWDLDTATAALDRWERADVPLEFIEQPLPAWDLRGHAELRRRVPVPVLLDESVFSVHDLDRAVDAEAADMVNIKLAKCGGVFAGREIARLARRCDLGLMVGSMMESELGVSAAAALASAIAPEQTHDLDAAWWSIDAADPGSPYAGDAYRLTGAPGLTRAAARVGVAELDWTTRRS